MTRATQLSRPTTKTTQSLQATSAAFFAFLLFWQSTFGSFPVHTTNYLYDADGNVTQKTDASSQVTNYSYDDIDRLKTVTYPAASSLNVTNTYDEAGHGFGIGHLTDVTDAPGTKSISYNELGEVTGETRVIGTGTFTTGYSYNYAGRLMGVTYPSGAATTYTRDAAGNISAKNR